MAPSEKKKSGTTHQQQIAKELNRRTSCGYQEALRRVAAAARKGLLPANLDKEGREEAVRILIEAGQLSEPSVPMPLSALAAWAQRAVQVLPELTNLFLADAAGSQDPAEGTGKGLADFAEQSDPDDVAAGWLYLAAGCIATFDQGVGRSTIDAKRSALDRLEQQILEHWRPMIGAHDFNDGFTAPEDVFQRDVWDLPTMTVLAGLPEQSLPTALRDWARAAGSVAAEDAGRALPAFDRARSHRFAPHLVERLLTTMVTSLQSDMTLPELVTHIGGVSLELAQRHASEATPQATSAEPDQGSENLDTDTVNLFIRHYLHYLNHAKAAQYSQIDAQAYALSRELLAATADHDKGFSRITARIALMECALRCANPEHDFGPLPPVDQEGTGFTTELHLHHDGSQGIDIGRHALDRIMVALALFGGDLALDTMTVADPTGPVEGNLYTTERTEWEVWDQVANVSRRRRWTSVGGQDNRSLVYDTDQDN